MFLIIFIILVVQILTFSISLEPIQSTPQIKLCNIKRNCQQILLVLDTGSSDLWISDISCNNCPKKSIRCLSKTNFKNQKHNQQNFLNEKEIQYGIGWVKGYQLDYKLCGIMTTILCVTNAKDINHYGSDGVIGIGGNSTGKQFLLKLMNQFELPKTISFFFGNYFSELTIGGFNFDYIRNDSPLNYFQTTQQWTLNINTIKINNSQISQNVIALIDTGSSLLIFPEDAFQRTLGKIEDHIQRRCTEDTFGIICPCEKSQSLDQFPNIEIQLMDSIQNLIKYSIEAKNYIYKRKDQCIIQIISFKSFNNIVILGAPFLKQYITLFDFQNQMIGLIQSDKERIKISQEENLRVIIIATFSLIILLLSKNIKRGYYKEDLTIESASNQKAQLEHSQ